MRLSRSLLPAVAAAGLLIGPGAVATTSAAAKQQTLQLARHGVGVFTPMTPANGEYATPEIDDALADAEVDDGPDAAVVAASAHLAVGDLAGRSHGLRGLLNRANPSHSAAGLRAGAMHSHHPHGPAPLVLPNVWPTPLSPFNHRFSGFDGLDHYDQRFADAGNQFSIEPPDMCVASGAGFVVQAVNDVVNVYDGNGNLIVPTSSLNQFFGYPSAINRTTLAYGPDITDPTCLFDQATQRFFLTVLTLDRVGTSGSLSGSNHLDIAVSQSADPTGAWNLYSLDATDAAAPNCPCLGDFPHTGADANGFYITTNEFPWSGGFNGAQIYAISKQGLVDGTASLAIHFTSLDYGTGDFVFAVMPATSPTPHEFDRSHGGTEWFMTALDAGSPFDNRIAAWAITNTSSLDATPALGLLSKIIDSQTYGDPLPSDQKAGSVPLVDAINAGLYDSPPPPHTVVEVEGQLDSSDSRMTTAVYTEGRLFGTNTTQLGVHGATRAGIAYFVVKPKVTGAGIFAKLERQGYIAAKNNNLIYSSIGLNKEGEGFITATLVGPDFFPSAAYVPFNRERGAGFVHIAAPGAGPQDGFTETHFFTDPGFRPRWGDYSATSSDGHNIFLATQYIAQTCTLDEYVADTSCGGTRSALANWGSFISKLKSDGHEHRHEFGRRHH
jgi:hypothetical protein